MWGRPLRDLPPRARGGRSFFRARGASPYTVSICDVAGRRGRTFEGECAGSGQVATDWDGTTDSGTRVSSGIYLYKAQAGDFTDTKRMIMLK